MKEIKTERTVYDIHYEAVDGTIFYNKEECEKYDDTARAVLRAKLKKLIVKEGDEYLFFGVGCKDSLVYAVKMETEDDMNAIKQLWTLDHTSISKSERYSEWESKAFTKIETAYAEMDVLFVGEDCEGCIYIINTRANIIEDLQNIDKKQDDTERENS